MLCRKWTIIYLGVGAWGRRGSPRIQEEKWGAQLWLSPVMRTGRCRVPGVGMGSAGLHLHWNMGMDTPGQAGQEEKGRSEWFCPWHRGLHPLRPRACS